MKNSISYDNDIVFYSSNNSTATDYGNITLTTSPELIHEVLSKSQNESFTPYAEHNKQSDSIHVFWRDSEYYVKSLNNRIKLCLSIDSKEVVGVEILNIKNLLEDKN